MRILGLNAFGQNPSACLVSDGHLAGFSHEERFNRLKGSHGMFPSHTIRWLLSTQKLRLTDIDCIAFNWDCRKYPWRTVTELVKGRIAVSRGGFTGGGKSASLNLSGALIHLLEFTPDTIRSRIRDELRRFGHHGRLPRIEFVDHHLCHAYQAYYHAPFRDTLVLVADGHGEENCVSGYLVRGGSFSRIVNHKIPFSLGWYYAALTAYLGFHANRDEGKLMGLAAYGEARKGNNPWLSVLDAVLTTRGDSYVLNPFYVRLGSKKHHPAFSDALVELITNRDASLVPVGPDDKEIVNGRQQLTYLRNGYIDLAHAAQTKLEDALVAVVRGMVRETGQRTLCFAGGVAMNCKANRAIRDRCGLEDMFVHPASSDDGSAIGAAFHVAAAMDTLRQQPLRHAHYGASHDNDAIGSLLKNCGVAFTRPDDVCAAAAALLNDGKTLGWFEGPAEMGARALGGRSIIANPLLTDTKDVVNGRVKYREAWRPYCPSILAGQKHRYLCEGQDSPFMITAATASEELRKFCPSVVHVDNTVRPQTVEEEVQPKWAHLIESFEGLSGHGVVLNTSFNVRGEPIVNTPHDALRTFFSTGLDAMVIGDHLIRKQR